MQLLEAISNKKPLSLYFLSDKNKNNQVLIPRIPDNFFTRNGYEDSTTPRVCFAPTIEKALMGLGRAVDDEEFYVHTPMSTCIDLQHPSKEQVPDVQQTGEVWSLKPVRIKCIGRIKVTGYKGQKGHRFEYGDGKTAETFGWKYEWVVERI